jgi:hypothetical protein
MKRLLSILMVMTGVVLLACSTCPAEEIFFKGGKPAGISFFSDGSDGSGVTSDKSLPFWGLPFGTYRLEGNLQLDQKKTSPIDIGKEKENVLSVLFSIKW